MIGSSDREINIRSIAITITFVIGIFMLFEYFVKWPMINNAAKILTKFASVAIGLSVVIGVGNLTRIHFKNVSQRGKNWIPSIVLLAAMWIPLIIGLLYTRSNPTYKYIFTNIYTPIGQAFFAILGFYILSAAYRAFRIRNFDAAIMVVCAIIVFMGNSPVSGLLWRGFPNLSMWLFIAPNSAGYRGILIGIAIGLVVTGIRTLLGREIGYLGERGKTE